MNGLAPGGLTPDPYSDRAPCGRGRLLSVAPVCAVNAKEGPARNRFSLRRVSLARQIPESLITIAGFAPDRCPLFLCQPSQYGFTCVSRHQARARRWLRLCPAKTEDANEDSDSRPGTDRADRRRPHQQQARRGKWLYQLRCQRADHAPADDRRHRLHHQRLLAAFAL